MTAVSSPTVAWLRCALAVCELVSRRSDARIGTCEMPVPHELEAQLLNELGPAGEPGRRAETLVALCLLH